MGGSLSRQDRLGQVPSEIAARILLLRDDALVLNKPAVTSNKESPANSPQVERRIRLRVWLSEGRKRINSVKHEYQAR